MYNKYIENVAPCFTRASAFLSPHASGDTRPLSPLPTLLLSNILGLGLLIHG